MSKRTASGIILTLLLIGTLTLTFDVQPVIASPTVHNIDTGLDYATIQEAIDAPETLDDQKILVDTGTYFENLTVHKRLWLEGEDPSNTVINGSGFETTVHATAESVYIVNFTITGDGSGTGVRLAKFDGIVYNCDVSNFYDGIVIDSGAPMCFVRLSQIHNNNFRAVVVGNGLGPYAEWTEVRENFIYDNAYGVIISWARYTKVFNNFMDNIGFNGYDDISDLLPNHWNITYDCSSGPNIVGGPCIGGNYWGDYTGEDEYGGPYQNETGSDGIGDTPYSIAGDSQQDNYPLVSLPVHNINTGLDYPTIQWAIDADETLNGHTIKVDTGTYNENVTVYKQLTLIGENRSNTIINGSGFETAVKIAGSDYVSISNLTIVGNDTSSQTDTIGLEISWDRAVITNCEITNFYTGILVNEGYMRNKVTKSIISHNARGVRISDFAIRNFIIGNFFINNSIVGVYICENSDANEVFNNFFDNFDRNAHEKLAYDNSWNTTYNCSSEPNIIGGPCIGGNYWSDYTGVDMFSGPYQNETGSDGIGDTPYVIPGDTNDQDNYPLISPFDVAIADVALSKTIVSTGYPMTINITSQNVGLYTETYNVTAYANSTLLGSEEVTVDSKNSTSTLFTWDTTGFVKGNYTISAYVTPIPGELRTNDNNSTGGIVLVTITGDVNGDKVVDVFDLSTVGLAYGSFTGMPEYSPYADITEDGLVDARDLAVVTWHYGETDP